MKKITRRNKRRLIAHIGLAGLALVTATQSMAQDVAKQSTAGKTAPDNVLEQVIVTSQKRAQDMQETSEAITAFSGEMLEAKGIANSQDLQQSVPNLSVGQQTNLGGAAKVTLRGIGSENFGVGGDPGVPMHINGHYTQSTAYVFRDMLDVARVEVQRGPQGTLYGRNAIGGNINIITNRPTKEFEGSVGYELGNYNRNVVKGVFSGPLNDSVRARLVVAKAKRDGLVDELGVGEDHDSVDYQSVRGSLEVDLTSNLQAYINAYDFDDKGDVYTRRIDKDVNNVANLDPFKVKSNALNASVNKSNGLSVDLNWNLDNVELRSLTAYDSTQTRTQYDVDGNAVRLARYSIALDRETYTQEFQALSKDSGPLKWVAGAFFYKEDGKELRFNVNDVFDTDRNGQYGTSTPPDILQPLALQDGKAKTTADSWAIYGQTDYDLNEKMQLIGGLRYTKDTKSFFSDIYNYLDNGTTTPTVINQTPTRTTTFPSYLVLVDQSAGTSWTQVTGKLGFNYKLDSGARTYVTYSNGYKAGGFSAKQSGFYDPEKVDAYEVGYKGRSADGKIQTNIAAFYYDYKDKQEMLFFGPTVQYPSGGVLVMNAAKAKTYGAEIEIQARITKGLRVDGSLSLLNATYDSLTAKDDVLNTAATPAVNLSGNTLPLSPKVKFNIGAQYNWALSEDAGTMSLRADYSWMDRQFGNAFNRVGGQVGTAPGVSVISTGDEIPAYGTWNARLQWKNAEDKLHLTTYVNNLTDVKAISNSYVGATSVMQTNLKPRMFGVKVDYFF